MSDLSPNCSVKENTNKNAISAKKSEKKIVWDFGKPGVTCLKVLQMSTCSLQVHSDQTDVNRTAFGLPFYPFYPCLDYFSKIYISSYHPWI